MTTCALPLAIVLTIVGAPNQEAIASGGYTTLLLSGERAPGVDPDSVFGFLSARALGRESGSVVFHGNVFDEDDGARNGSGTWSVGPDGVSLIARSGMPAPGMPDGRVFALRVNALRGRNGRFGAVLASGVRYAEDPEPLQGLWVPDENNALRLVLREGMTVPDANGENRYVSGGFREWAASGAGHVAATVSLLNPDTEDLLEPDPQDYVGAGLYRHDSEGGLSLVAMEGQTAPGLADGYRFGDARDYNRVSITAGGELVFQADLRSNPGGSLPIRSLWIQRRAEPPVLIALEGDQAPGTAPGVVYDTRHLNDFAPHARGGHVAFGASLVGPGIGPENAAGVWVRIADEEPHLVARTGSTPPGFNSDTRLADLWVNTIDDRGTVAFSGLVESLTNEGASYGSWKVFPGEEPTLIGMSGDPAPGTGTDITFRTLSPEGINTHGQAVMHGFLQGPGVTDANTRGIWAEDLSGVLRYVVRQGDLLDVSENPGDADLRRVSSFRLHGINDDGQVLFSTGFEDGTSGIFLSHATAIPEPSSAAMLVGFAAWFRRRSS